MPWQMPWQKLSEKVAPPLAVLIFVLAGKLLHLSLSHWVASISNLPSAALYQRPLFI